MSTTNIALEIFGICISVLMTVFCILQAPAPKKQTGIFISMLSVNTFVLLCDMLTWCLEKMPQFETLLYILNFFVYSLGYVLTALFTWYLVTYISTIDVIPRRVAIIISALCFLAVLSVAVSLFNHMYFSFENGVYVRGPLYWISQVYPIGIILINMIIVVYYHKSLGIRATLSLLSYGFLPIVAMAIQIAVYGITLLYLSTTLSLLIIYIVIFVEQSRRMERQKTELQQANIAVMLSQIQPHFLYNSLSVIEALCEISPTAAAKGMRDFSNFLRGNMDSLTMDKPVSFEQELNHTKNYLALEKLRFEDAINIEYDLQTTMFRLPTLTLQPIVENAVRYGITKREEGGTVKITTRETPVSFTVTIYDNGIGYDTSVKKDDGRTHIGITNVRSRLFMICGGNLEVSSIPGVGTTAVITIPKTDIEK